MGLYSILNYLFPKQKKVADEKAPEQDQDQKLEEAADGLLPKKEGEEQQALIIEQPATEEVAAPTVETPEAPVEAPIDPAEEAAEQPAVEVPTEPSVENIEAPAAPEAPIEAPVDAPSTIESPVIEPETVSVEVPIEAPAEPTADQPITEEPATEHPPVEPVVVAPVPTTKPAADCCADIHLLTSQKIMKIEEVKDKLNSWGTPYTLTEHSPYSYTVVYDADNKILIRVGWN